MSRKTWVVPLVGQWISRTATRLDWARPMVCCRGLAPKLLPEETCRWTVSGFSLGSHDLDPGADGRAVGLLADELHRQPVVPLTRVLEQDIVKPVAVDGAAGLDEHVDVAIAVPVAAGHAVSLLKVARAGGAGDLGEATAADILEHAVGNQGGEARLAGPQVHVEEAVVVKVGDSCCPWWPEPGPARLPWSCPRIPFPSSFERAGWNAGRAACPACP